MDISHKISDQDEEGLQTTFTDLFKQIKALEKANEVLLNDNEDLKGEINAFKAAEDSKTKSAPAEPPKAGIALPVPQLV